MRDDLERSAGRTGWQVVAPGVAVIVGLLARVAFLPVLHSRFVDQWDDQPNCLANHAFRGLGWPQVRWAWTTMSQGTYQPLAWTLFEAEYVAWGLDPRGYHLASLLLHAVNAVLFYILIQTLQLHALPDIEPGRRLAVPLTSGLAAALFAVRSLRVEFVAWASCQPYLTCAGSPSCRCWRICADVGKAGDAWAGPTFAANETSTESFSTCARTPRNQRTSPPLRRHGPNTSGCAGR